MTYCGKCKSSGKKKGANYGPEGGKATCCSEHGKELGYIDVANKKCEDPKCGKHAKYGPDDGGNIRTHCSKHGKELNLVDVAHKRCEDPKCGKVAKYGSEGEKTRTHCSIHGKSLGLVDVSNKKCEHVGCKAQPNFGDPDTNIATHCAKHKSGGMIDVKNKRCEHVGCKTQPSFGDPETNIATHCDDHKSETMINVVNSRCSECSRVQVRRKGDLCATCDVEVNGATRIIHVKEKNMIAAIQYILELGKSIYGIEIKYNESIGKAYGSYRPDIHINCGTFIIVIECDEFQHKPRYIATTKRKVGADGVEILATEGREVTKYGKSDEVNRMISIQSSRGLPCHVIRLNPDPFKIGGVTANVPIETRYAVLRDQVKLAFSNPPSSDLVVTYMYYDNDDSHFRTEIVDV